MPDVNEIQLNDQEPAADCTKKFWTLHPLLKTVDSADDSCTMQLCSVFYAVLPAFSVARIRRWL